MKTHVHPTTAHTGLFPRLLANAGVYFRLTKPKINLLLLISAAAGMLAAGGGSIDWLLGATVLAGGYLCSGGAGAMNCYLDRELDLAMARTRRRPLPSGQVTPRNALIFSIAISLLSIPLFLSDQSACSRPGHSGLALLCRVLWPVSEATDTPQHRDRRHSRRIPALDWLGGCVR